MFITLLSLFSFKGDSLPSVDIPHVDKAVHFTFYFVFTFLGCLGYRELKSKKTTLKRAVFVSILTAVIYGMVIEVLQGVATAHREPDILDFLANSAGAFVGAYAVKYIFSGNTSLKWDK
ncbi:VanZ family protein [Arenibacter aquaticus]|uniref:VanZ family protein n=1 Tax=Arenibacter aquaticus TaxID=2489054 RepID=UPI001304C731|nr:VanZ family protein [Arenibacter aquaticus]